MANVQEQLRWEISYLKRDLVPLDRTGVAVDSLNYAGQELRDSDLKELSDALKTNTSFSGKILLNSNLITDLGILHLTQALSESRAVITELDVSYNEIRDRSGVFIGDYMRKKPALTTLKLTGCFLEVDGLVRILENLTSNKLVELDVGLVTDFGLDALAKVLMKNESLLSIAFQEREEKPWSDPAKTRFLTAIRSNRVIQNCIVGSSDSEKHAYFLGSISSICERNKEAFLRTQEEENRAFSQEPSQYSSVIEYLLFREILQRSIQNLPVRNYMHNALGTLLNDGIYELAKFRAKENDSSKNCAVENVKWLVGYLLSSNSTNRAPNSADNTSRA